MWVERAGTRISTLDLFDRSYVLLTPPGGVQWAAVSRRLASELSLPLEAYVIGAQGDLVADGAAFAALYGVSDSGAVLVRPDGHVAWRVTTVPDDPAAALVDALGGLHLVVKAVV
jgi:putative polyketide hydroxylase